MQKYFCKLMHILEINKNWSQFILVSGKSHSHSCPIMHVYSYCSLDSVLSGMIWNYNLPKCSQFFRNLAAPFE